MFVKVGKGWPLSDYVFVVVVVVVVYLFSHTIKYKYNKKQYVDEDFE